MVLRRFIKDFYNPYFSKYPDPVANTLRRAIYYTNYQPDAELALKFYKKALEQSAEIGMDPFSDEVLGIRIQVSAWLEKIGSYQSAIEVLETLLKDCKRWIQVMEQHAEEGKINAAGRLVRQPSMATDTESTTSSQGSEAAASGEQQTSSQKEPVETLWRTRERVLAKTVGISTKLGEIYASEHVLDPENSHQYLVSAVETALEEFARRHKDGLRPGEETWLTPTELGGSMESLGNNYERKSQFHLAIPLFFQALRLCDSPCHRAVIMNNLSAMFAQHPLFTPAITDVSTFAAAPDALKDVMVTSMPQTRKECLEAALNWARNAYQHGRDVKGEERTEECDEACAVALCNWGDVAAMLGQKEVARAKYQQAVGMSDKLGFAAGVKQAREGLAKLTSVTTAATS